MPGTPNIAVLRTCDFHQWLRYFCLAFPGLFLGEHFKVVNDFKVLT